MTLSDGAIKKAIADGELAVEPFIEEHLQPASLDLTIDNNFLIVDSAQMTNISMDEPIKYREIVADEITIPANSFILATTREVIKLGPNICAFVEGRSSIGRMGLFVQNAGWIDPGFEGQITLELYNANQLPITVKAGRRVGQFVFARTEGTVEKPYGGKYKGQMGTTGSRIFKDPEAE